MTTPNGSKWSRRLLVASVSTFASLLLVEIVLRTFFPVRYRAPHPPVPPGEPWRELLHRASSIPGLAYELAPDMEKDARGMHIKTNHLGMRNDELLDPRPDNLLRITVVGDSVTFGFFVEGQQTYVSVLGNLLNASPLAEKHRYETLNLGVGGYSSRDEAIVIEKKALPLHPDLVIIGYFLNDPECDPIQMLHRYFHEPDWWEYSHLLRFLALKKLRFDKQRLGSGDLYRYLHAPNARNWQSVVTAFDNIGRTTRAQPVRVLLVVFPTYTGFESWETYPYEDLHRQVMSAAEHAGFDTLDIEPAFEASGHPPTELQADNEHPNALGHEIAARAIFERIAKDHERLFGVP